MVIFFKKKTDTAQYSRNKLTKSLNRLVRKGYSYDIEAACVHVLAFFFFIENFFMCKTDRKW